MADIGSFGINYNNTTSAIQPISTLGFPITAQDTINNITKQSWNITGFVFTTENSVSILYRNNADVVYSIYTSVLSSQSISSVLTALNELNLGYFFTETIGGNTFISTINDKITFSNINIYDSAVPQFQYSFFTKGTGGNNQIAILFNPPLVNIANPTQTVGDLSFNFGDFVIISGTTSNYGSTEVVGYDVVSNTVQFQQNYGASQAYGFGYVVTTSTLYNLVQIYEI